MEVSCPRCRAPAGDGNRPVRVLSSLPFRAVRESGRLVLLDAYVFTEGDNPAFNTAAGATRDGAPVPPPQPAGAIELPPDQDDELDLAVPPGHVFPGQRAANAMRGLYHAALWLRVAAVADIVVAFVIPYLGSMRVIPPAGRPGL